MFLLRLIIVLFYAELTFANENSEPHSSVIRATFRSLPVDKIDEFAQSKQWKRLLHYQKKFSVFGERSIVDGPAFFISPDGRTNPTAELMATIDAMYSRFAYGPRGITPYCIFVARRKLIEREFGIRFPEQKCEEYEKTFRGLEPRSISLIFASAFPNNPASMFGHTLLKINSHPTDDLLNHGLSYAAQVPPSDGGIKFMLFGVLGGYQGRYAFLPYFEKVNEYSNIESRDIWEYELSLTPEQIRLLIDHAWEIESSTYSGYYFFDENCAHQLLLLLEVARPDWDLLDLIIYYVPSETVKRVKQIPGAIKNVTVRPSLQKQMRSKIEILTEDEKKVFYKVVDRPEKLDEVKSVYLADALITYFHYQRSRKKEGKSGRNLNVLKNLLDLRAAMGPVKEIRQAAVIPNDGRPDEGHDSYRIGLNAGQEENENFYGFHWRSAFHGLMDRDHGFIPFSRVQAPTLDFRYNTKTKRFRMDEATLLNLVSLFPLDYLEFRTSFRYEVSYVRPRDLQCDACQVVRTEMGYGPAFSPFGPRSIFYSFFNLRGEYGSVLERGHRLGPEVMLGTVYNPVDRLKFGAEWSHFWNVTHVSAPSYVDQWQIDSSYAFERNALGQVSFQKTATQGREHLYRDSHDEWLLSLFYYFN